MATLNAKLMNMKLKIGWRDVDFAEYLNVSVEEFWSQFEKHFTGDAKKEFKGKLDVNKRRYKRRHPSAKVVTTPEIVSQPKESIDEVAEDTVNSPANEVVNPILQEGVAEVADSTVNNECKEVDMSKWDFEALLRKKEECTETLLDLEYRYKNILADDAAIKEEAAKLQEEYEKYVNLARKAKEKAESLLKRKNANVHALKEISDNKLVAERTLSEVEARIEEGRKVTIFVYTSGEVCIDSVGAIGIPTNNKEIFYRLIEEETLSHLTVNQHRALAKVICVAKELKTLDRKFEVTFEDESWQKYFEQYMKEE